VIPARMEQVAGSTAACLRRARSAIGALRTQHSITQVAARPGQRCPGDARAYGTWCVLLLQRYPLLQDTLKERQGRRRDRTGQRRRGGHGFRCRCTLPILVVHGFLQSILTDGPGFNRVTYRTALRFFLSPGLPAAHASGCGSHAPDAEMRFGQWRYSSGRTFPLSVSPYRVVPCKRLALPGRFRYDQMWMPPRKWLPRRSDRRSPSTDAASVAYSRRAERLPVE
jgi:hypothetical protein